MIRLNYVHDPMCSWCWGFRPAWLELQSRLPAEIEVRKVLGGLAPDTDAPMPAEMRARLQDTWRRIQARIPGTEFNFEFWRRNQPRRATYPACRAVLAARRMSAANECADAHADDAMLLAIQRAYYTRALNPSDDAVLIALADEIGLDATRFAARLGSETIREWLDAELALARALGVASYPALVLEVDGSRWPVAVEYTDAAAMRDEIGFILEAG